MDFAHFDCRRSSSQFQIHLIPISHFLSTPSSIYYFSSSPTPLLFFIFFQVPFAHFSWLNLVDGLFFLWWSFESGCSLLLIGFAGVLSQASSCSTLVLVAVVAPFLDFGLVQVSKFIFYFFLHFLQFDHFVDFHLIYLD